LKARDLATVAGHEHQAAITDAVNRGEDSSPAEVAASQKLDKLNAQVERLEIAHAAAVKRKAAEDQAAGAKQRESEDRAALASYERLDAAGVTMAATITAYADAYADLLSAAEEARAHATNTRVPHLPLNVAGLVGRELARVADARSLPPGASSMTVALGHIADIQPLADYLAQHAAHVASTLGLTAIKGR
jgi:hypothetical protein